MYESRNFVLHKHPVLGCDLIVCWRHNWPECPLEVLELEKVVMALPLRNGYSGYGALPEVAGGEDEGGK